MKDKQQIMADMAIKIFGQIRLEEVAFYYQGGGGSCCRPDDECMERAIKLATQLYNSLTITTS